MDSYSISDSYVSVHGGGVTDMLSRAEEMLKSNFRWFLAVVVVLIVILLLILFLKRENFMPTSTVRFQKLDGLGFSEHLDNKSWFSQLFQSTPKSVSFDPAAAPASPGSLGYQVLHSSDFDCSNRKAVGDDAWSWMQGVSTESMASGKSPSDNSFSKVLSGY